MRGKTWARTRSCFLEDDVHGCRRADVLPHLVAQRRRVDPTEKMFAGAEKDRTHREVDLVDQPGPKILADDVDAAADTNAHVAGGLACWITGQRIEVSGGQKLQATINPSQDNH